MEKASRRPMGARTVVMPTVWAERVISSIGMFVVFVLPDPKALLHGVWASFPLRVVAAESSVWFWDKAIHIIYRSRLQPTTWWPTYTIARWVCLIVTSIVNKRFSQ